MAMKVFFCGFGVEISLAPLKFFFTGFRGDDLKRIIADLESKMTSKQ